MAKTPEYTRRAVENYRNKFDLIQVRFPKGTKERITDAGEVANDYIVSLVLSDLESRESGKGIIKSRIEADKEAQDIFDKYGKKYVLSGLGQKELAEKYGEETAKKVIEYAMLQS